MPALLLLDTQSKHSGQEVSYQQTIFLGSLFKELASRHLAQQYVEDPLPGEYVDPEPEYVNPELEGVILPV